MKKMLKGVAALSFVLACTVSGAVAAENEAEPTHYPILAPEEMDWSVAGPFGK